MDMALVHWSMSAFGTASSMLPRSCPSSLQSAHNLCSHQISCSEFAADHMVLKKLIEQLGVLEKCCQSTLWDLCKGLIGRSKHCEWTFAFERIDQLSCCKCCSQ